MKKFFAFWRERPRMSDVGILAFFTALITFQPYFLHGRINIFEVGLYLPGINAILNGLIPFRDFFHLRGPGEVYVPAWLMNAFGVHIGVMYLYFYISTVLGLIFCVLLAYEIYQTRYVLYLMVPVLIARTFPRVVYTFWGGMRYAIGFLALFCAIRFFLKERFRWIFFAGIFSSLGFLISAEIGFCSIAGIMAAFIFSFLFRLQARQAILKGVLLYVAGAAAVAVPFLIYLFFNNALAFYLEETFSVVTNLHNVFDPHLVSIYPRNAMDGLAAMANPFCQNFRHMTPAYLYLVLFLFLAYRAYTKKLSKIDIGLVCLAAYGIIMYVSSFRGIWAAQFEMALQPEKILLFFLLGEVYLFLIAKKDQLRASSARPSTRWFLAVIYFTFVAFFASSVFYSLTRYHKRFTAYQMLENVLGHKPIDQSVFLSDELSRPLTIDRARGVIVPEDQARELEQVIPLIQRLTKPDEIVFTYPELGTYNFLANRPFLGKFPLATLSWVNDKWHEELMSELKTVKPRIVVVSKDFRPDWKIVYLTYATNRQKYDDVMSFIQAHYQKIATTEHSEIYQLKSK